MWKYPIHCQVSIIGSWHLFSPGDTFPLPVELRRVYPDIPNSKLQESIQMNKDLYGLGKTP